MKRILSLVLNDIDTNRTLTVMALLYPVLFFAYFQFNHALASSGLLYAAMPGVMVLIAGFSLLVVLQVGFLIFSIGNNDMLTKLSVLISSWMEIPENRRFWMGMSFAIIIGLPSWLVSRRITARFEY